MMNGIRYQLKGVTLAGCLVAVAVIVIIVVTAVPTYLSYLRDVEFKPTVLAAENLKPVVTACIKQNGKIAGCSSGQYSIPHSQMASAQAPGLIVDNGVITATAPSRARYGVAGATYILTPAYITDEYQGWHISAYHAAQKIVVWKKTGSSCAQDYADC